MQSASARARTHPFLRVDPINANENRSGNLLLSREKKDRIVKWTGEREKMESMITFPSARFSVMRLDVIIEAQWREKKEWPK